MLFFFPSKDQFSCSICLLFVLSCLYTETLLVCSKGLYLLVHAYVFFPKILVFSCSVCLANRRITLLVFLFMADFRVACEPYWALSMVAAS